MNWTPTNVYHRNVEAVQAEKRVLINQGGTSCFGPEQRVVTGRGPICIQDVVPGDLVKTYNEQTQGIEFKSVRRVFSYGNGKRTVRIQLKTGCIITATEDHKIWFEGGWQTLKHVLYLKHERNMEANSKIQGRI